MSTTDAGVELGDLPVTLRRIVGDIVPPILIHRAWVDEVLVQMVSKLEDVPFHRARHHDVVDQASSRVSANLGGIPQTEGTNLK